MAKVTSDLAPNPRPRQEGASDAATSVWGRWWRGLTGRSERRLRAYRLYGAVVAQARLPFFFRELDVPDSRDGRLEMIGLHAMLVMRRLGGTGKDGRALSQALFDLMFKDIDRHLREWGVGDLSVGKHVKRFAESLMGRIAALHPLLDADDADDAAALRAVLARNVYTERPGIEPAKIDGLALYLRRQRRHLDALPEAELLDGQIRFAAPESLADGRDSGPG